MNLTQIQDRIKNLILEHLSENTEMNGRALYHNNTNMMIWWTLQATQYV
jgi:hypothetical protein